MKPVESMRIVALMAQAYAVPAWSVETQELYAQMLEDLDREPTEAAVLAWIRSNPNRPTIADIRGAVREQLEALGEIPCEQDVDRAWGKVKWALTNVGRYRPFPDDDQAVKAAVDNMGWETLCDCDTPEVIRAQFERFYRAERDRRLKERSSATGLRLEGDAERLAISSQRQAIPACAPLSLPPPEERQSVVDTMRHLAEMLGKAPARKAVVVEPAKPTLRVPTAAEEKAAQDRRKVLREQLQVITAKGRAA